MDSEAVNVKDFPLHTGKTMPAVGFGCYQVEKEKTADQVYNAIKLGYTLIDEAAVYDNEKECGEGIKRALDEGLIKREDLFVTSKLWNTNHRKEHVKPAFMKSLNDLGLEYLDLYLIHFPISLKHVPLDIFDPHEHIYFHPSDDGTKEVIEDLVPLHETWAAMEELVNEGLVKHIGVSNM